MLLKCRFDDALKGRFSKLLGTILAIPRNCRFLAYVLLSGAVLGIELNTALLFGIGLGVARHPRRAALFFSFRNQALQLEKLEPTEFPF